MNDRVFIQTNHKQIVGALVAEHALRRNSQHNDKFDVQILQLKDFPYFQEHEGRQYLRDGVSRVWLNDDLQSFTLTRFMPPELMGYQGRAVVIDPDVFAVGDVWELLSRDMGGKAILARSRSGTKGLIDRCIATSVMLLDCAKLTHWRVEEQFEQLFRREVDYKDWICLGTEERDTIGLLEREWNDLDRLTARTKMLHTTKRKTQPWKTGLKVDFRPAERSSVFPPATWVRRARRKLFGEYGMLGHYKPHPDPNQERFFFGLLKECVEQGIVTEEMLRQEMNHDHVRHDAMEVLERVEPLAPAPRPPMELPAG